MTKVRPFHYPASWSSESVTKHLSSRHSGSINYMAFFTTMFWLPCWVTTSLCAPCPFQTALLEQGLPRLHNRHNGLVNSNARQQVDQHFDQGGAARTILTILLDPAAPGLIPSTPKKHYWCLLRSIQDTVYRKVDSGLKTHLVLACGYAENIFLGASPGLGHWSQMKVKLWIPTGNQSINIAS